MCFCFGQANQRKTGGFSVFVQSAGCSIVFDCTIVISEFLFEVASLSIAAGALMYAALAFRIAKQALVAAERSDLAALKLKAQEGRARAERSYLSLQAACHEVRRQWDLHHDRHFPKLGSPGFRRDDTHHILEVESEGRELLRPLEPVSVVR